MGHCENDVSRALLHNTIAQDMRERPLNESFENDTLDLINVVTKAQRLNLFILENLTLTLGSLSSGFGIQSADKPIIYLTTSSRPRDSSRTLPTRHNMMREYNDGRGGSGGDGSGNDASTGGVNGDEALNLPMAARSLGCSKHMVLATILGEVIYEVWYEKLGVMVVLGNVSSAQVTLIPLLKEQGSTTVSSSSSIHHHQSTTTCINIPSFRRIIQKLLIQILLRIRVSHKYPWYTKAIGGNQQEAHARPRHVELVVPVDPLGLGEPPLDSSLLAGQNALPGSESVLTDV
ncbi:hypothetical protein Tco_1303196 [Tanacetum coccineum]